MPRKWVEPVEALHNGKMQWMVTTPKDLSPDGKRHRRFFGDDKDEAAAFANTLNDKRNGSVAWFLTLPATAQSAIHTAAQEMGARVEDLPKAAALYMARQIDTSKTVAMAVDECLAKREDLDVADSSYASLKSTLKLFEKEFGKRAVASITVDDVEKWMRARTVSGGKREGQPILKSTRRGYVTNLRTLFNFAVERRYCHESPAAPVARPGHTDMPREIFTVDEAVAALNWLLQNDPKFLRVNVMTLFAGIRPDESRWIKDKHFRDGDIVVEGETGKDNRRRVVEANDTLRAWLALGGESEPRNYDRREARFHKVIQPWPHDGLRHSFVSYRIPIAGIKTTAREAAHSEDTLKRHYLALVTRAEAERFWTILPACDLKTRKIIAVCAGKEPFKPWKI